MWDFFQFSKKQPVRLFGSIEHCLRSDISKINMNFYLVHYVCICIICYRPFWNPLTSFWIYRSWILKDIEQDFQRQIIEKGHFCCEKWSDASNWKSGLLFYCCFSKFSTDVPFVHVCGMSWEECAVDFQSQQPKAGIHQLSASKLCKPRWARSAAHWNILQK